MECLFCTLVQDPSGAIKAHMVECGVIPAIIPYLDSRHRQQGVIKLSVAVVLNLCIDSNHRKNLMTEAGVVPKVNIHYFRRILPTF